MIDEHAPCQCCSPSQHRHCHLSADNLLYIKEDLIIPQHHSFYDLIVRKARGKSGPLFHFDVHDDVRVIHDSRVEKDEVLCLHDALAVTQSRARTHPRVHNNCDVERANSHIQARLWNAVGMSVTSTSFQPVDGKWCVSLCSFAC